MDNGLRLTSSSVSVIIPTYNQAIYVGNAIRSALQQDYKDLEIIIVDDGSTDNCREVVLEFGGRVHYIRQENQGLAGARNTGIRASRAEFIGLLDADDEWKPGYLDAVLSLVNRYPKAAVFYSCAQGMDARGRDLPQVYGGPVVPSEELYQVLLRANFLIPSTILMRRDIVVAADLFDHNLRSCEDWDLWLRILPEHQFVGTSERLVRYRIHGTSLSTSPRGMQRATMAVAEKNFGPDDGKWHDWSPIKRRVYGGVYRYHMLSSIQRENDFQEAGNYLRSALRIDPSLALDFDLYYQLAMGAQPSGYWGTSNHLDLQENALQIDEMLSSVFTPPTTDELLSLKNKVFGSAYSAIGMLAYNTGNLATSRHHLIKALRYQPNLLREKWLAEDIVKSLLGRRGLERLRRMNRESQSPEISL